MNTPQERRLYRIETGCTLPTDYSPELAELRMRVMAFLLENDLLPKPEDGYVSRPLLLGDDGEFGDIVLELTEQAAERTRAFLAEAASEVLQYDMRERDVVEVAVGDYI